MPTLRASHFLRSFRGVPSKLFARPRKKHARHKLGPEKEEDGGAHDGKLGTSTYVHTGQVLQDMAEGALGPLPARARKECQTEVAPVSIFCHLPPRNALVLEVNKRRHFWIATLTVICLQLHIEYRAQGIYWVKVFFQMFCSTSILKETFDPVNNWSHVGITEYSSPHPYRGGASERRGGGSLCFCHTLQGNALVVEVNLPRHFWMATFVPPPCLQPSSCVRE